MKTYIPVLAIMLFSSAVMAQEQTLLSGDLDHGGFGGPTFQLTQFDDQLGVMIGGHGGWIINHTVYLGGGGMGLVNDIEIDLGLDSLRYLDFGYGGLELGIVLASRRLIHVTLSSLIGGGGVQYRSSYSDHDFDNNNEGDTFFMVEPAVHVVLNVTRRFRIGLGGGYRLIRGVDLAGLSDDFLSGPNASLTLNFGSF